MLTMSRNTFYLCQQKGVLRTQRAVCSVMFADGNITAEDTQPNLLNTRPAHFCS